MNKQKLKQLLKEDFKMTLESDNLSRYKKFKCFIRAYTTSLSYKWLLHMRFAGYFKSKKIYFPLYVWCRWMLHRFRYNYHIDIPYDVDIKGGFIMSHGFGVVVAGNAHIGKNCLMLNGVSISTNGRTIEAPTIGDNVYIGTGAKIIGPIKIGNNAKIGANALVVKDVPEGATIYGARGREKWELEK